MDIDISEYINGFSAFIFVYMNDIASINISECTSLPVVDFVDCVAACRNLQSLTMRGCTQFSELHMLQMIPQLKQLRYLDLERCQEISFPVAHWIIGSPPRLSAIDFKPKNPRIEVKDWSRLHSIFIDKSFGISFCCNLPFYGQYVRLPEWFDDEQDDAAEGSSQ